MAANLAKGKNIGEAALSTLRSRLPNNPIAQAAFDAGVSLAKGQSIQQAALAATGKLLPKSPLAETALSFVSKAMSGQNLQTAALSTAGNLAFKKLQQAGGIKLPGVGTVTIPRLAGAAPTGRGAAFGRKTPFAMAPAFSAGAKAMGRAAMLGKRKTIQPGAIPSPQIKAITATGPALPAQASTGLRGLGQLSANLATSPLRPAVQDGSAAKSSGAQPNGKFPRVPTDRATPSFNQCMPSARLQCLNNSAAGAPNSRSSDGDDYTHSFSPSNQNTAVRKARPTSSFPPYSFDRDAGADSDANDRAARPAIPATGYWMRKNGGVVVAGAFAS